MGGLGIATQYPDFKVTTNALGHVVSITPEKLTDDELQQSDFMDDFLEHVGVKGMKWGVRRPRAERRAALLERRSAPSSTKTVIQPSRRGSQQIVAKSKAGKGVTQTKGGKRNVASDDALVAAIVKQKAKASTLDSVSNKELKAAVERMQLEKKFKDLNQKDPALKRAKEFLKSGVVDTVVNVALGQPLAETVSGPRKK